MSHKKFGLDRFSRFDVYWIQTDKPSLYIDIYISIIYIFFWNFEKINADICLA